MDKIINSFIFQFDDDHKHKSQKIKKIYVENNIKIID